jgi:hypothetical protein
MNGTRFDNLARSLATIHSRRSLLLTLSAGLLSIACNGVKVPDLPSDNPNCEFICTGHNMPKCQHDCVGDNNQGCQYNCTGNNATACQHDCAGNNSTGKCTSGCSDSVPSCPSGQTACVTTCTDVQSDAKNCGACGNVCPTGQTCAQGKCA